MSELLPCPFCAGQLQKSSFYRRGTDGYCYVHPTETDCQMRGQVFVWTDTPEDIERWNRRALPQGEPVARVYQHPLSGKLSAVWAEPGIVKHGDLLFTRPASDAEWQEIANKTPPGLDRILVAGWQPRSGRTVGYWWMHEDWTDETGKPQDHPKATMWCAFPTPPVSEKET